MIWNLILMIVVGAFIGGLTNYLAIKMLFRPYKAIKFGKVRLPFTPGLIPKRHEQISEQLGAVVEEYLVTEELLQSWITSAEMRQELQLRLEDILNRYLNRSQSLIETIDELPTPLQDGLRAQLGIEDLENSLWVKGVAHWLHQNEDKRIVEVLSIRDHQLSKAAELISHQLLTQMQSILSSMQGRRYLMEIVGQFLQQRSTMFNFFTSLFIDEDRIVDTLLPQLIKLISSPQTQEKIAEQITKLLQQLSERPIQSFYETYEREDIAKWLIEALGIQDKVSRFTEQPVAKWGAPLYQKIHPHVPMVTAKITELIALQIGQIYRSLKLSELVAKQVRQFPLQRLERLILDITSRELKAITYLGALLGGLIGFIQFFLVKI